MEVRYDLLPIEELSLTARQILSVNLNVIRELGNKDGIPIDVRGVADLRGFPSKYADNFLQQKNPTAAMLESWNSIGLDRNGTSAQTLLDILRQLDRRDILHELKPALELSWTKYQNYMNWLSRQNEQPTQVARVSSSDELNNDKDARYLDEDRYLSTHDTPLKKAYFDVFISCTGRGEDLKFAKYLVKTLEEKYGLKCFLTERDGLGSGSTCTIHSKLIKERCRKFLVLISRDYEKSVECSFQVRLAQSLSPGAHAKRIIPVLIQEGARGELILKPIHPLDYTRDDLREYFWDRLVKTIKIPTTLDENGAAGGEADNLSLCVNDTESWIEGSSK